MIFKLAAFCLFSDGSVGACFCSIISIKGAAVGEASVVNGLFNLCDIYQHKHNQFLVSHFASFRFCCRTINISANFGMNNLADN